MIKGIIGAVSLVALTSLVPTKIKDNFGPKGIGLFVGSIIGGAIIGENLL